YNGTVTITSLGSVPSSRLVSVALTVVAPPPAIVPSASSLDFVIVNGQSTPAQALSVLNGGYGSFGYTVSSDSAWLLVSSSSGSTPGNLNASVNPSGLALGSYSGHIIITAPGVSNSPLSIPVRLEVLTSDLSENFVNASNGWIVSPMGLGTGWSVSNGVYSHSGLGLSQSCTGNSNWSDYVMDANIKLSSLSNWPGGIRSRVDPSTGAGYAVWLYPASG